MKVESGRVYSTQSIKCGGCEKIIRYNVTNKPVRKCKVCRTVNEVKYKE